MGISCTGTGVHCPKKQSKMGMGLRFEQDSHMDHEICAIAQNDFVKMWPGKWEQGPPSGSSLNNANAQFSYS